MGKKKVRKNIAEQIEAARSHYENNSGGKGLSGIEKVDFFTDATGMEWRPRVTTPVILTTCREVNLTISNLMDFDINVADLFEALWFSCEGQAKESKVTKEVFTERVTPDILAKAFSAYWTRIAAAFPTQGLSDKMNGGPQESGPLEVGK